MAKLRNAKTGLYTTPQQAAEAGAETVAEDDTRANQLRRLRAFAADLRSKPRETMAEESFVLGLEHALSFFD